MVFKLRLGASIPRSVGLAVRRSVGLSVCRSVGLSSKNYKTLSVCPPSKNYKKYYKTSQNRLPRERNSLQKTLSTRFSLNALVINATYISNETAEYCKNLLK